MEAPDTGFRRQRSVCSSLVHDVRNNRHQVDDAIVAVEAQFLKSFNKPDMWSLDRMRIWVEAKTLKRGSEVGRVCFDFLICSWNESSHYSLNANLSLMRGLERERMRIWVSCAGHMRWTECEFELRQTLKRGSDRYKMLEFAHNRYGRVKENTLFLKIFSTHWNARNARLADVGLGLFSVLLECCSLLENLPQIGVRLRPFGIAFSQWWSLFQVAPQTRSNWRELDTQGDTWATTTSKTRQKKSLTRYLDKRKSSSLYERSKQLSTNMGTTDRSEMWPMHDYLGKRDIPCIFYSKPRGWSTQ